tara:strand:- start:498 stop:1181 length:684 start_codon:yes stop_codon:yes gene_type:complete
MSNYKKEGEWSTVGRKKNKRKSNTHKQKRSNNEEKSNKFYQEDRRWTRDKYFRDKSNRRERKSTTTDFPKLSESQSTSIPYTQSGPKWSNLINKDTDKNADDNTDENIKIESDVIRGNFLLNTQYKTQKFCVRNQVPKNNYNVSYSNWEISYFKYLIDLYNIFCEGMKKLEIPYLDTIEVFENFCYFIRDSSSGEISPYLDSIDNNLINNLEDIYYEYTIKRYNQYN